MFSFIRLAYTSGWRNGFCMDASCFLYVLHYTSPVSVYMYRSPVFFLVQTFVKEILCVCARVYCNRGNGDYFVVGWLHFWAHQNGARLFLSLIYIHRIVVGRKPSERGGGAFLFFPLPLVLRSTTIFYANPLEHFCVNFMIGGRRKGALPSPPIFRALLGC